MFVYLRTSPTGDEFTFEGTAEEFKAANLDMAFEKLVNVDLSNEGNIFDVPEHCLNPEACFAPDCMCLVHPCLDDPQYVCQCAPGVCDIHEEPTEEGLQDDLDDALTGTEEPAKD